MRLTNLDRVVFPADGITKGELVEYHRAVAPRMLRHLRGRPLTLERFRRTIDDGGFYQQSSPSSFPRDLIGRAPVARADGRTVEHPVADSADALVFLSNQGALTLHAWPARLPDLERPDQLVLDLDPPEDDFAPVRAAAAHVRAVLDELALTGLPMTTGSRGVHVVVPLDGALGWDELWALTKGLGAAVVARSPKTLTRALYKSQRRGRLYLDTGRARRGHTAVAPYTVRARPAAPVATPITWDELEDDGSLHARSFTVRDVLERPEDPWAGAGERGQSLASAIAALGVDLHAPPADGPVLPHNRPR